MVIDIDTLIVRYPRYIYIYGYGTSRLGICLEKTLHSFPIGIFMILQ
jgi:hypothetical protein